ncbi:hypothetical protein P692DRAFT_201810081 [Suillus brevipes Sb2]|nr:hypothetical protein P692DRAFT_201810081 [Suillus brevipes Sb2]
MYAEVANITLKVYKLAKSFFFSSPNAPHRQQTSPPVEVLKSLNAGLDRIILTFADGGSTVTLIWLMSEPAGKELKSLLQVLPDTTRCGQFNRTQTTLNLFRSGTGTTTRSLLSGCKPPLASPRVEVKFRRLGLDVLASCESPVERLPFEISGSCTVGMKLDIAVEFRGSGYIRTECVYCVTVRTTNYY